MLLLQLARNFVSVVRLYPVNTDKCTHVILNHHFINTVSNSKMFQPLKCHFQEV